MAKMVTRTRTTAPDAYIQLNVLGRSLRIIDSYCRRLFPPFCWVETEVPGLSSSVPRTATVSPSCRPPKTSVILSTVAPVFTSTHSDFPSRTRTTNTRSRVLATDDVGTNIVGYDLRTGHWTSEKVPGESSPFVFAASNSTGIVRVFWSSEWAMRVIVPLKVRPGKAGTEKSTLVPSGTPAAYVSGTGTTTRKRD